MSFYKENHYFCKNTLDYEKQPTYIYPPLPVEPFMGSYKQQEAEALIKKSVEALYNNPKQASYYAAKVIELFPEERQNDQKAEAMFYYSQAEKLLGNFDVSIKNLYDALEYATPTNKELNGQIYALIGALYCKLTDYNKAIEMSEKAISIDRNE